MFWTTRTPLHTWNPWSELEAAHARLLRGSALTQAAPPIEAWRKDDVVLLRALVPGVTQDALDLTVEGDTLTLKVAPQISRTLRLPFEIDAARVRATLANGRLVIELPRAEHDKPRRVAIQSK